MTVFPGYVNKNIGYAYDGYIWNRTGETATWTFAEFFDDNVYLVIDGVEVLNNTQWDVATIGSVEVAPGPHRFHLVVYQGTGGSGPSTNTHDGNAWMRSAGFGVCVDFQGRGEKEGAYFQKLEDDGAGTLFTLTTDAADIVAGNALAVDNVNLSGVRIVVTGDADQLDKNSVYTLLTATGSIVGEPSSIEGLPRGWAVKVRGDRLVVSASNGFAVMIQ